MAPDVPASTPSPLREAVQPFLDLVKAPRALWGVNLNYFLEGVVYWGWLSLLAIFFNIHVGLDDIRADWMVSVLTAGITGAMFVLGGVADRIGVRRALLLACLAMLAGRFLMVSAVGVFPSGDGLGSPLFWASLIGLLGVVVGYGLYQPAAYAGVREYLDAKTAAMGFAMLYALQNAGGAMPGLFSPFLRQAHGIPGVYWTYVGVTGAGIVLLALILTPAVERQTLARIADWRRQNDRDRDDTERRQLAETIAARKARTELTLPRRVWHWAAHHPLTDTKFAFFIFALIPVQTLFAHQWLTLPQYVHRAMGPVGEKYMEFFVNSINPVLIFVLSPTVAALTRRRDVYPMMIVGTLVMALPTFLLTVGTNLGLLVVYLVLMSLGEAIWQPRFLQYAAEIAPKGRTGEYMGVAQLPWFLTKVVTGLYAGWFVMRYVPEGDAPKSPETMWIWHGAIAMVSPLLLVLAWNRLGRGFRTRAE